MKNLLLRALLQIIHECQNNDKLIRLLLLLTTTITQDDKIQIHSLNVLILISHLQLEIHHLEKLFRKLQTTKKWRNFNVGKRCNKKVINYILRMIVDRNKFIFNILDTNSIKSSEFPSTPNNAPRYAAPVAPEKESENTYGYDTLLHLLHFWCCEI